MSNRYYHSDDDVLFRIYIVIIIILIGMCLYRPINKVSNERQVTATVTDKNVKNSSDDSKYLVYTIDENNNIATYEITDSFLKGRFNSSDVYAGIEVGKTYTFTIAGSRNGFLSWYPNIYEYQEVK
jgi:hypothetical protein